MAAEITTDQVWTELKNEMFAVVGMVTARNQSRTVGIVYVVHDRRLFFGSETSAWKTKHLRSNPHVSVTVPIAKRIPFAPWIKIPAATISFSGTARVLETNEVSSEITQPLLKDLEDAKELRDNASIIEITPVREFLTYGVGVSLKTMRRPSEAWGRVSVG